MTPFTVIPHRLFDRRWRSGHPFCPRLGRLRRVVMLLLLLIFSLIIGGYNYVTDSGRVRDMAQKYLSDIIGGKVEVGSATLSIFEGLRVDDVKVYVDAEGNKTPDSLIFTAQSFVLKYDPRTLLAGQLEASQIIAQKPRVYLTENLDNPGTWNFHRLGAGRARRPRATPSDGAAGPIPMPEVLLRNARVDINEFRAEENLRNIGFMSIDGQLTPTGEGNRYRFEMQAHGAEGVGPYARGEIALNTQDVKAELHNFDFRRDVRSMLPIVVRDWQVRHGLDGRIENLELTYSPARADHKASFRVDAELKGVTLGVPPEDWMSAEEVAQLRDKRHTLQVMRDLYAAAGFALRGSSPTPVADASAPASPSALDILADALDPTPITLKKGAGRFIFTEAGILVKDVSGQVENNAITVNGHIDGYGPDAPAALVIRSSAEKDIFIPPNPHWARTLPKFIRDIYQDIRPTGTCRLELHIDRPTPGTAPVVSGRVDVVNGNFNYRQFPYPVREASGTIAFGPEPERGGDFVKIINFRGRGMKGGPNENMFVVADGEIGPLGPDHPDPEVKVIVTGTGICSEPALAKAYPWEIANALAIFDADKKGQYPQYRGSFGLTLIHTAAGKWTFDTDVDLEDASGRLVGFPYPLDHISGRLQVRDGYVDIVHAMMHKDGVEMDLAGRVVWGEGGVRVRKLSVAPVLSSYARQAVAEPPEKVDLKVHVKGVPINNDLVNAIPPEHRYWIRKLGIGGTLDCDGRVTLGIQEGQTIVGPARLVFPQWTPRRFGWQPEEITFDLGLALRDGTFWPADGTFSVSDVSGKLHLTRDGMDVQSMTGKRGDATLAADGAVRWADGKASIAIRAGAKKLPLDSSLYALLPEDGRRAWDEIQPQGAMDVDLTWRGEADRHPINTGGMTALIATEEGADNAVASVDDVVLPATQPTDLSGFYAVLKPAGMTCTIKSLPYRLDGITGAVTIDHGLVRLADVVAHHGAARITADGSGNLNEPRSLWDIHLTGQSVVVDDDFRKSVPATLQTLTEALKLRGTIDFDFPKLIYRGAGPAFTDAGRIADDVPTSAGAAVQLTSSVAPVPPRVKKANRARRAPAPTSQPTAGADAPGPDIDLAAVITLHDGSLEAGVPMTKVNGKFGLSAIVSNGKLSKLEGDLDFGHLTMAGREVTHFRAILTKPPGTSELNLDKVQAVLADGQLAGQLHMVIPDEGTSRYTLGLVLRNADVRALVGEAEKDLKGELTASVSLEGAWGESSMRRGRGDVTVTGRELYHMPLILGLVQVTNLSLPIGSPFNQGLARYSVEGERVNFERIELKSDTMVMTGGGHLDFGTKQVRMTFTTDNPSGFKIPFVNDIWQGARQELFKINIKGSIQQPKVEATPFGTVTTTIDEVLRGDAKKEK